MEMTNEELARLLERFIARLDRSLYNGVLPMWIDTDHVQEIQEAAARLRQQSEAIDYPTAKRAINLFEGEYIGQSVPELWRAMVDKARKA